MSARMLVYGDVDLNVIDGSAVWAVSVVEALSRAGCEVTFLLKAGVRTQRLVEPLHGLDHVHVIDPFATGLLATRSDQRLSPEEATDLLGVLDERDGPFDALVLRGINVFPPMLDAGRFTGRLWSYVTEMPQTLTGLTPAWRADLEAIAAASRFMLVQTEELRDFVEEHVPSAGGGRSVLFPPVVPAVDVTPPARDGDTSLRLVYTGKFAPAWRTLEMTELPIRLAARGVEATMHMVGDKLHADPKDRTWRARMSTALREAPGVVWHGGVSRAEALAIAGGADIGLSWRRLELDATLELSTKVLEYGAVGLPVIVGRTPAHEGLLGRDYPMFASTDAEVVDLIARVARDLDLLALAAARCRQAAAAYSMGAAVDRIRALVARLHPQATALVDVVAARGRPLRVGVAGHDLKFFTRILEHLQAVPQTEVRVDAWASLGEHDEAVSAQLAAWADVVIAEWCGPVAIWYSQHKRPAQRLIVRLHRFELDSGYPAQVSIDAVDQVVCVSPYYGRLTVERTGWPADKVVVVPNIVDIADLDRPKRPGARFHLGVIGWVPARKRLDRALDIVEELRRADPRYRLFVKSKMPWDYWWVWRRDPERVYTDAQMRRIATSPRLAEGVVFDGFGANVASWLRGIGHVLSTSDDESFHLAPAEGMASSAVPVILPWPGADTIYDPRWIHADPSAAAQAVLAMEEQGAWPEASTRVREQVRAFGPEAVLGTWTQLLVEDLPSVRALDVGYTLSLGGVGGADGVGGAGGVGSVGSADGVGGAGSMPGARVASTSAVTNLSDKASAS